MLEKFNNVMYNFARLIQIWLRLLRRKGQWFNCDGGTKAMSKGVIAQINTGDIECAFLNLVHFHVAGKCLENWTVQWKISAYDFPKTSLQQNVIFMIYHASLTAWPTSNIISCHSYCQLSIFWFGQSYEGVLVFLLFLFSGCVIWWHLGAGYLSLVDRLAATCQIHTCPILDKSYDILQTVKSNYTLTHSQNQTFLLDEKLWYPPNSQIQLFTLKIKPTFCFYTHSSQIGEKLSYPANSQIPL